MMAVTILTSDDKKELENKILEIKEKVEDSGQNVELDTTLTQSGKAADAKAVGDALDELEEKIPSIEGLAKSEDIPKVPNWAMQASKPTYTASEVGALPNTYAPPDQTAEQVGADPTGTAASAVSAHNANNEAHPDIRLEIKAIREQLAAFLDVDEETLNELSELIARIVANQTSIEQLTTGKVSVADIINNLTTNAANKPLSAAQGVALKTLIDGLSSGKLDASKLTEAINTALAQAKTSGEFDGKDGTSVTVKSVTESTADGGSNVVVFSDGKTLTVKNGKTGSPGSDANVTKESIVNALGYTPMAASESEWVQLETPYEDGYLLLNNGSKFTHSVGRVATVDISGCTKVQVTGYQFVVSNGFTAVHFRNASGDLIKAYGGTADNKVYQAELDVPEGAVTMNINGKTTAQPNISASGLKVYSIMDTLEAIKPTGKKLITLGDSITALGTGSTGWVKHFLEKTGCELVANVAVNGATLKDKSGTTYDGNPVFNGPDNNVNNVLGNQVQKIINNNYSAPDIIIIAIGTNDGISITKDQIKDAYYDSSNNLVPLDSVDRETSAGAYRWCLEKLHTKYPNALIFWCTPIMGYQKTRSAENAMAYAESLRIATEYTGQMMIDTIRCGINGVNELSGANGQYLVDGLHPNANGAKKIGYYNAAKVIPFLGNSFALS